MIPTILMLLKSWFFHAVLGDSSLIAKLEGAYDATVWDFLQHDILEKFINKEHIRGALYAGTVGGAAWGV